MKAIICFANHDVHIHSFGETWTSCQCGNVRVKWLDSHLGTVVVAAKNKNKVRLLGLNNAYLIPAISTIDQPSWDGYRQLHEQATEAPGYIFDKHKAACWATVVPIGSTGDVRWATAEEEADAFREECVTK